MYESPIEIMYRDMGVQIEGEIVKAVWGQDIHVDKEELEKALLYDRNQYIKGYEDGKQETIEGIKAMIKEVINSIPFTEDYSMAFKDGLYETLRIIDKYRGEEE